MSARIEARCKPGDLWQLGAHRLLCGDATKSEDIAQLMQDDKANAVVTDMPYAILGGGISIAGRSIDAAFDRQFFRAWFHCHLQCLTPYLHDTAAYWSTIDWRGATAIEEAVVSLLWRFNALGVWDRGGLGMGYALRKTHEHFALLTLPGWKPTKTDEPDVWRYPWYPASRKHGHQAEKPIELMERAMNLCGGSVILDPFAGSGTTLIASQNTGRHCYAIEISPEYCDIILARYEDQFGTVARRVTPAPIASPGASHASL